MPGTKHFSRMDYHVSRGLSEIVAPNQTIKNAQWNQVLREFGGRCIFCGKRGNRENRGIVPDHLIPVKHYGELVIGNAVPACQTCNDSRGERDWRLFMRDRFPDDAGARISRVEQYLAKHPYQPLSPGAVLLAEEYVEYHDLIATWNLMFQRAKRLQQRVTERRKFR